MDRGRYIILTTDLPVLPLVVQPFILPLHLKSNVWNGLVLGLEWVNSR